MVNSGKGSNAWQGLFKLLFQKDVLIKHVINFAFLENSGDGELRLQPASKNSVTSKLHSSERKLSTFMNGIIGVVACCSRERTRCPWRQLSSPLPTHMIIQIL